MYMEDKEIITFENEPSEKTPLSEENLNKIQNEIINLINGKMEASSLSVADANKGYSAYPGIYRIQFKATNFPFDTSDYESAYLDGVLMVLGSKNNTGVQIAYDKKTDSFWYRCGWCHMSGDNIENAQFTNNSPSEYTDRYTWKNLLKRENVLYINEQIDTLNINNITLSDSAENYDFIEIYYNRREGTDDGAAQFYTKVEQPNDKYVSLSQVFATGSSEIPIQIASEIIHFNENIIERIRSEMMGFSTSAIVQNEQHLNQGRFQIIKVIGYKK